MSAEARLRFYARVFDCVEVNSSYYAIPDVKNTLRWVERTPPGFVFHVKAYSLMTGHHPKAESVPAELQALLPRSPRRTRRGEIEASSFPPEALDATFMLFGQAVAPIAAAGKLGYVLFQFAPWVHFEPARLAYLASLPARLPGWTLAVEFRHRSWFPDHAADTLRALRGARLAHVIVDGPTVAGAVPRVTTATASTAVFRLHGRNAQGWLSQLRGEEPPVREKYDYLYSEDELRTLLPEVEGMAAEAERVFVSFNNNNRDYPVRNALMLKRLLGQPIAGPPIGADFLPGDLFA
ncbi:MAG: DUF72 domain-containing protein [Candidatus Rokubacteria bacterium]|nr:DUF72 domain-containing protein [Candidatus Rokubacteria bacterium]